MALLYMDSMYAYYPNNQIDYTVFADRANFGDGTISNGAYTPGRWGAGSYYVYLGPDFSRFHKRVVPNTDTVTIGFSYAGGQAGIGAYNRAGNFLAIDYPDVNGNYGFGKANLYYTSGQTFDVRLGSTVLASVNLGGAATWYYIEMQVKTSPSAGTITVMVDGTTKYAGTGLNTGTYTAGNTYQFYFGAGSTNNTPDFSLSDLYFLDSSGSNNTTFLGNCRVEHLTPSSTGTFNQFTPSVGSDSTAMVNDYDVSDYIQSDIPGFRQTFNMTDLASSTGVVRGVQQIASARRVSGASRTVGHIIRSGVSVHTGTSLITDGTSRGFTSQYEINPTTGVPWTLSEVNATEFGVEIDPPVLNPEFRSAATTTGTMSPTISATMPTGYQAGDMLVLGIQNDRNDSIVTPSGWTLAGRAGTSFVDVSVFYKTATGAEGSTLTITTTSSGAVAVAVIASYIADTYQGFATATGTLPPSTFPQPRVTVTTANAIVIHASACQDGPVGATFTDIGSGVTIRGGDDAGTFDFKMGDFVATTEGLSDLKTANISGASSGVVGGVTIAIR